jgi:hypothetical protein
LNNSGFAIGLSEFTKTPKISNSVSKMLDEDSNVERNVCFVKRKHTYFYAKRLCEESGMQFYNPRTSDMARVFLEKFGREELGGSEEATVYVDGRKGDRCQAVNGKGALVWISCKCYQMFLCEYYEKSIENPCEIYEYGESAEEVVEPLSCKFETISFRGPNNRVFANESFMRINITVLYISFSSNTTHIPNDLAESFPNLIELDAQ